MEQLKPFIDGLKANKFWIFCGVTLIACVVVYYMVNGSLKTEESSAISKIKSTVTEAQNLATSGVPVDPEAGDGAGAKAHPNQETIDEMEKVVKAAAAATKEAWREKHSLQAQYQVFDKDTIREPNVDFQQYLPAESVPFTENEEEGMLPETVRVNYRDRIREELPKLAELVGSYWKPRYDDNMRRPREIIIWNEDNQDYWHSRYTNFASPWNVRAKESNVPRTLQVLYTTEDLWLLRSILKDIIGKTVFSKGDVYANDLAVIKEIDHILIGKDAEPGAADTARGSGGGSSSMSSSSSMGSGMSRPTMGAGGGGGNSTADSLDPIHGRYVDNTGKDIAAADYRALYANAGSTDKTRMHWKIAKRVKVRIGLQMDTREIQNLLANCANATFPLEVRSIRVNQHKASKLSGSGSGAGSGSSAGPGSGSSSGDVFDSDAGPSAGGSSAGGASNRSGPPGGPGGGGGAAAEEEEVDQGYTKPVEIYGFMYIYNEVDDSMFKILDEPGTSP